MLVTEQNPKSLGNIVSELDISGAKGVFAKTQFSMCIPEVSTHISQILLNINTNTNIYLFYSF
jgi:hypothetical protein